jgi:hypothetical protein
VRICDPPAIVILPFFIKQLRERQKPAQQCLHVALDLSVLWARSTVVQRRFPGNERRDFPLTGRCPLRFAAGIISRAVSPHERHCIEKLTDVLELAAREPLK